MKDAVVSVWILGDQLLASHPALAAAEDAWDRDDIRVVLVESRERTFQLSYQRKKLVLLFSAMRHYAESLRRQGYVVDYRRGDSFVGELRQHTLDFGSAQVFAMAASEFSTRRFQEKELATRLGIPVHVLPNQQFLASKYNPYAGSASEKRVVMEHFYRRMRRHHRILVEDDALPVGGKWNYDRENQRPLPAGVVPPGPLTFTPDDLTREAIADVDAWDHGLGSSRGFDLAVSRDQALEALADFVAHRLDAFGPYEDAMSSQYPVLYHSQLAQYLNIGLLEPLEVIDSALEAYRLGTAPINSVEGFVRQVLGWREYVYWQYWRHMPQIRCANAWQAERDLPRFFWDGQTAMKCLHHTITRALETGYTHHIERLMVLCNFCLLAGIRPQRVNRWFLTVYVDAYEWVVVPNVIGMGLHADGGLVGTKPYIASANYINKMSDYCRECSYERKARTGANACPFNFLYWSFLVRNEEILRSNPRMGPNVLGLRHLDDEERQRVMRLAVSFLENLP